MGHLHIHLTRAVTHDDWATWNAKHKNDTHQQLHRHHVNEAAIHYDRYNHAGQKVHQQAGMAHEAAADKHLAAHVTERTPGVGNGVKRLASKAAHNASQDAHAASHAAHTQVHGQYGAGQGRSHQEHMVHHRAKMLEHTDAAVLAADQGEAEDTGAHLMASTKHQTAYLEHSRAAKGISSAEDAHGASKRAFQHSMTANKQK